MLLSRSGWPCSVELLSIRLLIQYNSYRSHHVYYAVGILGIVDVLTSIKASVAVYIL